MSLGETHSKYRIQLLIVMSRKEKDAVREDKKVLLVRFVIISLF